MERHSGGIGVSAVGFACCWFSGSQVPWPLDSMAMDVESGGCWVQTLLDLFPVRFARLMLMGNWVGSPWILQLSVVLAAEFSSCCVCGSCGVGQVFVGFVL